MILRKLSDFEMTENRRPFLRREDRWPTLTWPRQIPIAGTPADVVAATDSYSRWMATNNLPKLFVNANPGAMEAELANVIWMSVRGDVLTKEDAPAKLRLAARLGIHSASARKLWQGALQRALESGVAVYDTLFVELADREQLPLATFDKKVLTIYPDIAKRPKDLM